MNPGLGQVLSWPLYKGRFADAFHEKWTLTANDEPTRKRGGGSPRAHKKHGKGPGHAILTSFAERQHFVTVLRLHRCRAGCVFLRSVHVLAGRIRFIWTKSRQSSRLSDQTLASISFQVLRKCRYNPEFLVSEVGRLVQLSCVVTVQLTC